MLTACCREWLSLELFYASENFYRKLWQTSWRREFPSSPPPSKISMFTQVLISYQPYPCSWLVETTYPCLWLVNLSLPCQDLLMNQVWWLSWPVPVVTTGKYWILIGWDNLYSLRIGWYSTILISDWLTYYNTNIWLVVTAKLILICWQLWDRLPHPRVRLMRSISPRVCSWSSSLCLYPS